MNNHAASYHPNEGHQQPRAPRNSKPHPHTSHQEKRVNQGARGRRSSCKYAFKDTGHSLKAKPRKPESHWKVKMTNYMNDTHRLYRAKQHLLWWPCDSVRRNTGPPAFIGDQHGLRWGKSSPPFQTTTGIRELKAYYLWDSLLGISESQNTENN